MELIAIYDNNANKTDKTVDINISDDELSNDEHIGISLIYIENNDNKFLIQKTSLQKGNRYSMTSGHIRHNETSKEAIIREAKEELGIDISKEKIIDLGHILVDYPVRFIFYLKKNININDIKLNKNEVESVCYKSIDEIKAIIESGQMHKAHLELIKVIEKYRYGVKNE